MRKILLSKKGTSVSDSLQGPVVNFINDDNSNYVLYYGEQYAQAGSLGLGVYMGCIYFEIGDFYGSAGIHYVAGTPYNESFTNLFTLQSMDDNSTEKQKNIILEYSAPGNSVSYFNGQNAGMNMRNRSDSPMPWTTGPWYANVIRCWRDQEKDITHVAFFMYEYNKNIWTHYITVAIPKSEIFFRGGCNGFLLRDNSSVPDYSGIYGQYFAYSPYGGWQKAEVGTAQPGECGTSWDASSFFQGAAITLRSNALFDNTEPSKKIDILSTNNKPKPFGETGETVLHNFRVVYSNALGTATASWDVDKTSPPQLSYQITIWLDTYSGRTTYDYYGVSPSDREISLTLDGISNSNQYLAVIFVTSIFDVPSAGIIVELERI